MWPFEGHVWYLQPRSVLDADPSVRDGVDAGQVARDKHDACRFISKIGRRLHFPYRTIASSQLYFHLFFARHSMKSYPHMDIALTAILVASKAEETYKKIRQILAAAFLVLNPSFAGSDVDVKIVEEHRLKVTQYEHAVLEAIDFNFTIRHAHEVLAQMARTFDVAEEVALEAFAFVQQSYHTPIVLCYPPEFIAMAALISALKNSSRKRRTERELAWAYSHGMKLDYLTGTAAALRHAVHSPTEIAQHVAAVSASGSAPASTSATPDRAHPNTAVS